MGKYRNSEGYSDITAGKAISYVAYQEKKGHSDMSKRNCRLTTDEKKIHEKAVKMRKMTDEQLVEYVENRVAKAESEGFNRGKKKAVKVEVPADHYEVRKFIEKIATIPGVGHATMNKINIAAREDGYIGEC